jgi:hypothetical protein
VFNRSGQKILAVLTILQSCPEYFRANVHVAAFFFKLTVLKPPLACVWLQLADLLVEIPRFDELVRPFGKVSQL